MFERVIELDRHTYNGKKRGDATVKRSKYSSDTVELRFTDSLTMAKEGKTSGLVSL